MRSGKYLDIQFFGKHEDNSPQLGLYRIVKPRFKLIQQEDATFAIDQRKNYSKNPVNAVTHRTQTDTLARIFQSDKRDTPIGIFILIQDPKMDKDRLNEIVDLMLETVCTARKTIRIAGDDYPAELVKSKFLKLNSSHIEFVLDCMRENTTKVRNIKQYLKAVLFNAPSTIDSYYTALVNHDLYGGE